MHLRTSLMRSVVLSTTVVVVLALVATGGTASAKGRAARCHKAQTCTTGQGGGGATGGPPPSMIITLAQNPLIEAGQSEVYAVVEVTTNPSLAGDTVLISSSQLQASCGGTITFDSIASGVVSTSPDEIAVTLDDDGNAAVVVSGSDCAPGSSVIEADLTVAPYYTALQTLVAQPPLVTLPGVTGYPNYETETGDSATSGNSDVYAVFYVETDPVYAEQPVEISSAQLEARCGLEWRWQAGNQGSSVTQAGHVNTGAPASTTLDDDGNAVFVFYGASCATGYSEVDAEVMAGSHPTYLFGFTIEAPAPTI